MLITHIVVGFNMFQLCALHVRLRHRAFQLTDHGDSTHPEDPVITTSLFSRMMQCGAPQ